MNPQWQKHRFFAALDWASDHHDVAVMDPGGKLVLELRFEHSGPGWAEFDKRMQPYTGCPITIETSSGSAVDQLLQRGWAVYPINPKAAQRYRERSLPSGTKSDRHDTWTLANALRNDGAFWRPLLPQDDATTLLRALCRDEISLIEQRTHFVNQLQAALIEYYPTALAAFDDWTSPAAWSFISNFPTPEALLGAGRRRWEKFLHTHRLWRGEKGPERLEIFAHAEALPASAPIVTAKSLLASSLVSMLQTLEGQLAHYRQRINAAFRQHPDHDIFGSLPGAGEKLAPRLAAEMGMRREVFPDPDSLGCQAGVSPIRFQSGHIDLARLRHGCNKVLRATLHLWADCSRRRCEWAQAYYQGKRARGFSHACALRCLANRWTKILWRLWQNRVPYNDAVHLANQRAHGSWVAATLEANRASPLPAL